MIHSSSILSAFSIQLLEFRLRARQCRAARMRLYRRRRRRGERYLRLALRGSAIDALVRRGLLKEAERDDPQALELAVCDLLATIVDPEA